MTVLVVVFLATALTCMVIVAYAAGYERGKHQAEDNLAMLLHRVGPVIDVRAPAPPIDAPTPGQRSIDLTETTWP